MPRVQIPKEKILDAALRVILRDGHRQMNIKTVAAELGRSTQTISWAFGNMEAFREKVWQYALSYVNKKMHSSSPNPMEEYGTVGIVYIHLAYDAPNLIRYLRSDEGAFQSAGGFGGSFDSAISKKRRQSFAAQYGCSEVTAEKFMESMLIYTQGLVSMILAGGLHKTKEEACQMLVDIGRDLMCAYTAQGRGI